MYDYWLTTGFVSLLAFLVNFYHRISPLGFAQAAALMAASFLGILIFLFSHWITPVGCARKGLMFGFLVTTAFLIGGIPHVS